MEPDSLKEARATSIGKYRLAAVMAKIENHRDLLVRRNEQELDTPSGRAPKRTHRLPSQGTVLFL